MVSRLCTECRTRNPTGRSVCYNCNGPVGARAAERRREQEVVNELREQNGKPPRYDLPQIDHDAEPPSGSGGVVAGLLVVLAFTAMLLYIGLALGGVV